MSVNGNKRGRPGRDKEKLSKESIIECARTLLKKTGKLPSIRGLAKELGVDPMAIYHYFANKSALLEAVSISLMESIYEPSGKEDWQNELRTLCMSYLSLLNNHTGLLETMLSMDVHGPAQVFMERFQLILRPLKLSDTSLKNAIDLIADYLHGFALAVRCNWDGQELKDSMIDGPLSLYIRGLEAEANQG